MQEFLTYVSKRKTTSVNTPSNEKIKLFVRETDDEIGFIIIFSHSWPEAAHVHARDIYFPLTVLKLFQTFILLTS